MSDLISVIIPVYNVEPYLDACIKSVVDQTYPNLEIILIDDGSQDQCPAICDAWKLRDERIRVCHQRNGGLSAARNAGIELAKGAFLAFVDSDDTVHPQLYETLYHTILQTQADIAMCDYVCSDTPVETWPSIPLEKAVQIINRDEIFHSITVEYVVAWNKLYHRSLYEKIRYPEGRFHEDEFAAHRILWNTRRLAWVHYPMYGYLQRKGSIIQKNTLAKWWDALEAFRERVDFCAEHKRKDLAIYSADTYLSYCEKLCLQYKGIPADLWQKLIKEIQSDSQRWRRILTFSQKLRFHWLVEDTEHYFQKVKNYRGFLELVRPNKAVD